MDLYAKTSYQLATHLTNRYSTSFSLSSKLFDASIRRHIYAIYGMVRLADEIVDTYKGEGARTYLDQFEKEVISLLDTPTPYSTNPLLHAFGLTAQKYKIEKELIIPFFDSMRTDLTKSSFTQEEYEQYIYGSAEVIGLMCLRVFTEGDTVQFETLKKSAQALGAAYQKVNFLRDLASDAVERGRCYFPGVDYVSLTDAQKRRIEKDIARDFAVAATGIDALPKNARKAVRTSFTYYERLFRKIQATSAETLKRQRVRVPDTEKISLLVKEALRP